MSLFIKTAILILAGLATSGVCFASDSYNCPRTVHLASGTVASEDVPPGYESVISNSVIHLSGFSMFDGPPKEGAALKPTSTSSQGNVVTWKFEGSFSRGKWISCDYADGLVRVVVRAVDSVTSCVAEAKTAKPQGNLSASFTCR
jgi:hypothetical protein